MYVSDLIAYMRLSYSHLVQIKNLNEIKIYLTYSTL